MGEDEERDWAYEKAWSNGVEFHPTPNLTTKRSRRYRKKMQREYPEQEPEERKIQGPQGFEYDPTLCAHLKGFIVEGFGQAGEITTELCLNLLDVCSPGNSKKRNYFKEMVGW